MILSIPCLEQAFYDPRSTSLREEMHFVRVCPMFAAALRVGAQSLPPCKPTHAETSQPRPSTESPPHTSTTGVVQDSSTVHDLPSNGRD